MNRLALVLLLAPLAAAAEPPDFSRGGMIFGLQYGTGRWGMDRAQLASQVDPVAPGDVDVFIADAQGGHTASLRLGYNILGHATLEAALTGTGWNVMDTNRGGAGFLVGALHWHPLELFWRKQVRPVPLDASLFFGMGYGIAGQRRGLDGQLLEAGADATWYFSRSVGAGLFARGVFFNFDSYYFDFDNKVKVALPQGSGGSFWTFGLSLDFRFET